MMNQAEQHPVQQSFVLGTSSSKLLLKIFLALLFLLVFFAVGLWVWSGSNGSLVALLSFAERRLKPQTLLVTTDIKGSIRHGGSFGKIRWERDGLRADLLNVDIRWEFLPLFNGRFHVSDLKIDKVHITRDKPTVHIPDDQKPSFPDNVSKIKLPILPMHVDVQKFAINFVYLSDNHNSALISDFTGQYRFDKKEHALTVDKVRIADGDYQGKIKLAVVDPYLDASLKGALITSASKGNKEVKLNAFAEAKGPLNQLKISADIEAADGGSKDDPKMSLQAVVVPGGGALVLPFADLTLQAFNVNAFWPEWPITLLSGTASVVATNDAQDQESLALTLNLKNGESGRLGQKKLPFSTINGHFTAKERMITAQNFNASTGNGALSMNGHITLSPDTKLESWNMEASLQRIDPRLFTDKLQSDALSGTVKLSQKKPNNIDFDIRLNAAYATNIPEFRAKQVSARGSFDNDSLISFNTFTATSHDATVSGNKVTYLLDGGAVSGPVKLVAPGFTATAVLNNFAKTEGEARVSVDLKSVELASSWIKRQPYIKANQFIQFLGKLQGVVRHLDRVAHLTRAMPILMSGGWQSPVITVEMDPQVLITAIAESRITERLTRSLDKLKESEKINDKEKNILRELGGRLGGFLQQRQ